MINDLISKTGITPHQFKDQFFRAYPNTGFNLVMEVTKNGDFKGDQAWTHIVDSLITIDNYIAEAKGRYGTGEKIVWEEGAKRFNPKRYEEIKDEGSSAPQKNIPDAPKKNSVLLGTEKETAGNWEVM